MVIAIAAFGISLLGIMTLFVMKRREATTGRVIAPHLRDAGDTYALLFKTQAMNLRAYSEKLPPLAAMVSRSAVREAALMLASLAHHGEKQAHKLAEVVSHKHRFERRAPRSEFLRRVAERGANNSVSYSSGESPEGAVEQKD